MTYEITIEIDVWEAGEDGEHLGYGSEEFEMQYLSPVNDDKLTYLAMEAFREALQAAREKVRDKDSS